MLRAADPGLGPAAPLATYPLAKEDVALVVDESVAAADVESALRAGAGELLESIRLFDVYRTTSAWVTDASPWRTRCASARPTAR